MIKGTTKIQFLVRTKDPDPKNQSKNPVKPKFPNHLIKLNSNVY